MSQVLIQNYLRELTEIKRVTGSSNETVLREAFKTLLKDWGKNQGLFFTAEYPIENAAFKYKGSVDGALLYELRRPFGYWEAKDENDDIDVEIEKKRRRGYPQDNIIFEDGRTLVLLQHRQEVGRCDMGDALALERFLNAFFRFQRPEVAQFRAAIEQFKQELPSILQALRDMIAQAHPNNPAFAHAATQFLEHCQTAINPSITADDVREMLLQHILTEEIFAHVFNESDFHRHNNIAKELYALEATFFTGALKKNTLKGLEPYYAAIRASAAEISSHAEKQKFLKAIYENFYQVYNRKAADRLGVVYTPNEIVRFMIESTDWLTQNHFGKNLIHSDVEILDPATGTGTFVCELLEYFKGSPAQLAHKFAHELFANEVAILPYYVANLNIEATYAAIAGSYAEFPNLCFVDTLDNVDNQFATGGLTSSMSLFGSFSGENVERIQRQNSKKISVIIGNPPYNANQLSENDNNKNREYPHIDNRIKKTYIAQSTAQKTKLYDMYARFFRWASDRLNDNGVLAFVTNRSFIESRTFDGFRKVIAQEFNEVWIVDLGGDVRANPKLSGTKHNVFGIQTGVAISFLVKKKNALGCKIFYTRRPEFDTAEDKLAFISTARLPMLNFERIEPDAKNNWLNHANTDFESLLPLVNKETKGAKTQGQESALFKLFSLGVSTNRDEWVIDYEVNNLRAKVTHFMEIYKKFIKGNRAYDLSIKWSRNLKRRAAQGMSEPFSKEKIFSYMYRPYARRLIYASDVLVDEPAAMRHFARGETICFSFSKDFHCLCSTAPFDLHMVGDTYGIPLNATHKDTGVINNITEWGLHQFVHHYGQGVTKEALFHYVYAVLHNPIYRKKYALNLKREFPRIPLYGTSLKDFTRWAAWGKALMDLHINYETVTPFALKRIDIPLKTADPRIMPTPKLKANKTAGTLIVDEVTTLQGVPAIAWDYKIGSRSALEWVLDQYKESKPKDPTIREKFNPYRFAHYKEHVIDLLCRVCTVSVQTQAITEAMTHE